MQSLRNKLFQATKTCLILSCFVIWASGQSVTTDKLTLTRFEKGIEDGKWADVEGDLLNYVITHPKDAKGFVLMAKLRFKQNRLSEARSLLLKALTLEPDLIEAKLSLAKARFQLGETQEARAVLDGISWSKGSGEAPGLELAQMYVLVGEFPKALETEEKLSLKIRNNEALPLRATCYLESGDKKNFDELMPIAKAVARSSPPIAVRYAEALSKALRHKETADLLRLVVAASPKNTDALLLLAKSEISLRDYDKARIHLEQAEKILPVSAELFFTKAVLESEQGNYIRALELLERSLAENPDNMDVLSNLVITAMRANQAEKAVRAAEKLITLRPEDLDFLYLYGAASLQNNNFQKAENALGKFLEARPQDSRGCLALGLAFAGQSDKFLDARQQLQKCLTISPNNFEAAYQLGLSYKTQGESVKAIEYFEQAVRLSPN